MKIYHSHIATKILFLLTTLLMLATLACPASAAQRTVRVGYYITPSFQDHDKATGAYNGYSYEYLLAIAQHTGWKYEFVPTTFGEALTMLAKGELDLVNNVSYTQERTTIYEYSAIPSGRNFAFLVMLPERAHEVAYEEYEKFSSLTVAMVPGRSYSEAFLAYCQQRGCMPKIVYYDSSETARNAWQNKEVDAYVGTSSYSMPYHIIAKFHPENFYLATTKGNTELMRELDDAMNALYTENPYFERELHNKYYSSMAENNATLSDKERAFIAANPLVKVVYDKTEYPLSYQNDKGEFAGAMRDIYNQISEKTGLRFQFIACDSDVRNALKIMKDTSFVVAELPYDFKFGAQLGVYETRPFASISCIKVSRENNESGGVMAVVAGYYLGNLCREEYGNKYTYVEYPDTRACIDAVKSGEADCTFMSSYEYEYYSSQSNYRTLFYKIADRLNYQLSIAISTGAPPELKAILSKALNAISTKEILKLLRQSTRSIQRPDLATMLYRYPQLAYPLVILLGLLIGVILLYFFTRRMARKNRLVLERKNAQLREAMETTNEANHSKSRFLAQMSHEIRTPMNAIVGMTAMAHKATNDPEKITGYLNKIDTSSRMLLGIINNVLDMSAIESNKLKLASETFDLKQIINGITTVYYPQCANKGVDFSVNVTKLTHEILVGDALRLNQILMNLVSNAFKFTEAGGHISFAITELPPHNDKVYMRFRVADDGCGISEDLKTRLFHAFEQESASTARKHGGSGLGLAITKNLIDMMHGAVEVESAPGKGTVFTVSLPFTAAAEQNRPDPDTLRGLTVLVVDDDSNVVEYACEILDRMGVSHETASCGKDALALTEAHLERGETYDVCLLDWQMPDMDGMELTRLLRKKLPPDTLIIIISAYNLSDAQDEAKNAGANLCLEKPFFQSTLFNALLSARQHHTLPDAPSRLPAYDFSGKRVLLVDDFELNLEVATDLLEDVHMTVDCAEDGRQAVDIFTASAPGTYDVILMDIQMPVMDGLEAAREIRKSAHPQAKDIPLFAMTANAFVEDVAAAMNAGMNGHIAKPVDTTALYKLLYGVLYAPAARNKEEKR